MPTTTLRKLDLASALALVEEGAALVDLRPVDDYLGGHVRGSLSILYESGPGFAARARDCVPLDRRLILLDEGTGDMEHAAASLRGKGFDVLGSIKGTLGADEVTRVSTPIAVGGRAPDGTVLDVRDPGAEHALEALQISIERLWVGVAGVPGEGTIIVAAGYGVRAALAVGILERAGIEDIVFWRTRAR